MMELPVPNHDKLLLEVWREAGRHIEIRAALDRIYALLRQAMPLAQMRIKLVDSDRQEIDTLAVATDEPHSLSEARQPLDAKSLKRLVTWCRQGEIMRVGPGEPVPAAVACLPCTQGQRGLILAPLALSGDRLGLVAMVARLGDPFSEKAVALVGELLEAIAVAVDSDHRLREIAALGEAAEAEKRSLLAKLGRKQLGDTIVGLDSGLRAVMDRVELVARSDVPVLIFGETGSGKELVARAIHQRSRCAAGPFIRVNCGAIPHELIDSQLFGHERGAFTGATETRKGWFERADGGTLLLDEIGELTLAAQVRLLRIVQDGWLERVGGHQPNSVSVRIVAATHRDLAAMVAEGKFREDLWYRLAVFPIVLPPLRERRDDIAPMARHFAERAAVRFGLAPTIPTPEDLALLEAYDWPGNVRELAAVVDRAAILGDGRGLEVSKALGVPAPRSLPADAPPLPEPAAGGTLATLDACLKRHIEAALRMTGGRIEGARGAAKLLAVNPHTLRGKMRRLKIDWRRFREAE